MTDAPDDPTTATPAEQRAALLDDLRSAREFAIKKSAGSGRIRDHDRVRSQVKLMNLAVRAAQCERRLIEDQQLDDLSARLDELEDQPETPTFGEEYR